MDVDEFVARNVAPEFQDVVAMLRQLMRDAAPDAVEVFSYGMPCYKQRQIISYIYAAKKDIKFSFVRGTQIHDRWGLLKGRGKSVRHVILRHAGDANLEALRDYIEQAKGLDQAG